MAEGAPLLREYTLIRYRGFESPPLRHYSKSLVTPGFFYAQKLSVSFLFAQFDWVAQLIMSGRFSLFTK